MFEYCDRLFLLLLTMFLFNINEINKIGANTHDEGTKFEKKILNKPNCYMKVGKLNIRLQIHVIIIDQNGLIHLLYTARYVLDEI